MGILSVHKVSGIRKQDDVIETLISNIFYIFFKLIPNPKG